MDNKTLNKFAIGVASVFGTLIPVILALQPDAALDVAWVTAAEADSFCGSAEGALAMQEFVAVVNGAAVLAPDAGACMQNVTVGEMLDA